MSQETKSELPVFVLSYGVARRLDDPKNFRATWDSKTVALAALQTAKTEDFERIPRIMILGARFNEGKISDAPLMAEHITNPKRQIGLKPGEVVIDTSSVNTLDQIGKAKRIMEAGNFDNATVICASWHKPYVEAIVNGEKLANISVQTDEEILGELPQYKKTFEFQRAHNKTYKYSQLQAKLFSIIYRMPLGKETLSFLSAKMGVGIKDYDYRGSEKGFSKWVYKRQQELNNAKKATLSSKGHL